MRGVCVEGRWRWTSVWLRSVSGGQLLCHAAAPTSDSLIHTTFCDLFLSKHADRCPAVMKMTGRSRISASPVVLVKCRHIHAIVRADPTLPENSFSRLWFGSWTSGALCCVRHSSSCSSRRGMRLSGDQRSGNALEVFGKTTWALDCLSESSEAFEETCSTRRYYTWRWPCASSQSWLSVLPLSFNHTEGKFFPSFQTWAEKVFPLCFSRSPTRTLPHPLLSTWNLTLRFPWCCSRLFSSTFPKSFALAQAFLLFGLVLLEVRELRSVTLDCDLPGSRWRGWHWSWSQCLHSIHCNWTGSDSHVIMNVKQSSHQQAGWWAQTGTHSVDSLLFHLSDR